MVTTLTTTRPASSASIPPCPASTRANAARNSSFSPSASTLYRAESAKIRAILVSYTPRVEPLSLDEAYLDVTGLDRYAWDIARDIRKRIFEETRLTGSAGIAPNKMLAKIASDWRKPNGQFAVTPDQVETFVRDLPVRKIWGIGPEERREIRAARHQDLRRLAEVQPAGDGAPPRQNGARNSTSSAPRPRRPGG